MCSCAVRGVHLLDCHCSWPLRYSTHHLAQVNQICTYLEPELPLIPLRILATELREVSYASQIQ
eukprot:5308321-Heterocapsa_arctica.AAC.1